MFVDEVRVLDENVRLVFVTSRTIAGGFSSLRDYNWTTVVKAWRAVDCVVFGQRVYAVKSSVLRRNCQTAL